GPDCHIAASVMQKVPSVRTGWLHPKPLALRRYSAGMIENSPAFHYNAGTKGGASQVPQGRLISNAPLVAPLGLRLERLRTTNPALKLETPGYSQQSVRDMRESALFPRQRSLRSWHLFPSSRARTARRSMTS